MKKILIKMKDESIKFVIKLWNLNWETKLGIFILLPPIWSVYSFFYDEQSIYDFTVYLGLMAIAGAYLIKSNRPNKNNK